jgi:hypothetical protein
MTVCIPFSASKKSVQHTCHVWKAGVDNKVKPAICLTSSSMDFLSGVIGGGIMDNRYFKLSQSNSSSRTHITLTN